MESIAFVLGAIALGMVLAWLGWRPLPNRGSLPCPTSLASPLDNPFTASYHKTVLARQELTAGMQVLDAGCGLGLLGTQIAHTVSPSGRLLALDVQPGMIAKARERALQAGVDNVDFLVALLGAGKVPVAHFDRALLVNALGEIPDKVAAHREISLALKQGGLVSIIEVLLDPQYRPFPTIVRLTGQAGLRLRIKMRYAFMLAANFEKSLGA